MPRSGPAGQGAVDADRSMFILGESRRNPSRSGDLPDADVPGPGDVGEDLFPHLESFRRGRLPLVLRPRPVRCLAAEAVPPGDLPSMISRLGPTEDPRRSRGRSTGGTRWATCQPWSGDRRRGAGRGRAASSVCSATARPTGPRPATSRAAMCKPGTRRRPRPAEGLAANSVPQSDTGVEGCSGGAVECAGDDEGNGQAQHREPDARQRQHDWHRELRDLSGDRRELLVDASLHALHLAA